MNKSFYLIIVSCFLVTYINAQSYRCLQFSNRQGLPSNLTKGIGQDDFGFFWVATDNGLARFDGVKFEQFSNGLPSSYVKSLIRTRKGRLLASTDMGVVEVLSSLDAVSFKLIARGSAEETDSTVRHPKLIYEDTKENIWITDEMGMCRLKNGKFKRYTFSKKLATYSYYRTFSLAEIGSTIYVFSQNGFSFYFDEQRDRFVEMTDIPKFTEVNCAYANSNNQILICSSEGIYELTLDHNKKNKGLTKIVSGISASYILKMGENQLLLSSWDNGVFRFWKEAGEWKTEKLEKFPFQRCNFMIADRNNKNNVLVGTDAGIVLIQKNFFETPTKVATQNYINSIGFSDADETWFSCKEFIYKMKSEAGAKPEKIFSLVKMKGYITVVVPSKQHKECYWLASSGGDLFYLNKKKIVKSFDLSSLGKRIFYGTEDASGSFWICIEGVNGVLKITRDFKIEIYDAHQGLTSRLLVVGLNKQGQLFGGGMGDSTYLYEYLPEFNRFINRSASLNFVRNKEIQINDIAFDDPKILMGTNEGVLIFKNGKVTQLQTGVYTDNLVRSIAVDKRGAVWFSIDKGVVKYYNQTPIIFNEDNGLSTITMAFRCMKVDPNNHLWLGTPLGLNYAKNNELTRETLMPNIIKILVDKDRIPLYKKGVKFIKGSYLTIAYNCLSLPGNELKYQYRLYGEDDKWIDNDDKTELLLPALSVGMHKLQIRAKQQGNFLWSESREFNFEVITPWFQTWWAYLLFVAFACLTVWLIVIFNLKRLRSANVNLDKIVKIRTFELKKRYEDLELKNAEIKAQRDEIIIQKNEITAQRNEIIQQKNEIEKKNRDIISSIEYAQRIQEAVLSSNEAIKKFFPDHFIFYKPCEIVSGDFYYMKEVEGKLIFAAVDCTGHGVPGGFMSMLGITLLNEIVLHKKHQDAAEILNQLREQVKLTLQQTGKNGEQQDGMDIALCCIDLQSLNIEFAGANCPFYLFQKNEATNTYKLNETKGDHMPIGIHPKDKKSFTCHTFQLYRGDVVYLFSDGLISQFGGEKGQRFKSSKFKNLLNEIHLLPMDEQQKRLEKCLQNWMGKNEQVDDILVLGVRIS